MIAPVDEKVLTPAAFAQFLEDMVVAPGDKSKNPEKLVALRQILQNLANFTLEHQDRKRGMQMAIYSEATFKRALYSVSEDNSPLPDNVEEGSEEALEYRSKNARRKLEARKYAILNPGENGEILTAHPTSSLDIDDIQRLQALQTYIENMPVEDFQELARKALNYDSKTLKQTQFALPIEEVRTLAADFYNLLDPAKKLSVEAETERAIYFAQQRYHAIPIMLGRMDEALDLVEPSLEDVKDNEVKLQKLRETLDALEQKQRSEKDGEAIKKIEQDILNVQNLIDFIEENPRTALKVDDLRRMGKAMQTLSWQADQDSKDNVTAEVIEAAILENKKATRALYEQSLEEILKEFKPQDKEGKHAVRRLGDLLKKLREKTENFKAEDFIADLEMIKGEYENQGGKFPMLKRVKADGTEMDSRFSQLDALIVQAHNCGDCHPRVEIRQNATRHRNVLEYIKQNLHRGSRDDDAEQMYKQLENNNDLGDAIKAHLEDIEPKVAEYRASYKKFLEDVARLTGDEKQTREQEAKKIKDQLDFYETMKTAELASKYPESVNTYVIAETGLQASKRAEELEMERDEAHEHIVNGALKDMFSVMLFTRAMAEPGKYAKMQMDQQLPKVIPLMENRGSIASASTVLDKVTTHSRFLEHIQNTHGSQPPEVYDPEIGRYRVMTIAEAKIAMGADPAPERNRLQPQAFHIDTDDWNKPLTARTVVMFAGSDSMRENGLCIGPINQFNQQEQALAAIAKGIWVDIFNGTGGAAHRSNPAPFISSRRTVQGAENHYATPAAIAAANETYLATNILLRENYYIPEEHCTLAAAYPGHVGNSLMLPMETSDICYEAREPLLAGCKAHAALFEDERYDAYFAKSTALEFTKWFNHSARPDARSDRPFSTDSLRAIGYNLSKFGTGENGTLYKGMYEFLDIQLDGSFNLDRTVRLQQNSYKIQDMMTRATIGCVLADFDNAWRYVKGCEREIIDGKVAISSGDKTETIEALAAAFKQKRTVEGFSNEALVMAHFEFEQRQVARAIYETYRTIQVGGVEKVTDEMRKEWNPKTFDPKQLFDIMPPTMREEYAAVRENLTEARKTLAHYHFSNAGDKGKMEKPKGDALEKLYNAYLTITDGLESGSHLSLKNASHTFQNDFAGAHTRAAGSQNLAGVMQESRRHGYVIAA